jgi:CBS domain containing-hemolysin-like protein
MEEINVKSIMVPLSEYTAVSENATLYEAVLALEEAQKKADQDSKKRRSILVIDRAGRAVGTLDQWDVIKGLEPKCRPMESLKETSRFGFSPDFIKSMMESYSLWRTPLMDICKKADDIKVKDIMHSISAGYVDEETSVNNAIQQMITCCHQSLLVTRANDVVGILQFSDVFKEICNRIKACRV